MADDRTPPEEQPEETPAASEEQAPAPVDERAGEETPAAEDAPVEAPADAERPQGDPLAAAADEPAPADAAPAAADAPAAAESTPAAADAPAAAESTPAADAPPAQAAPPADAAPAAGPAAEEVDEDLEEDVDETPRVKPEIPGADLEVDIVEEGADPLSRGEGYDDDEATPGDSDEIADQPIAAVTIDLGAGARYRATGKRKTAIARVILLPGTGAYTINGRELDVFFPRATLQRNIRQPLEAVGYDTRMDVIARMQGGGVSSQAGALRHGISRALLEADPNLRGELKRRGFLTRDPRVKERKKAGLKKARKRPQFSKR
jgi:small subunit ribosomal protein S9